MKYYEVRFSVVASEGLHGDALDLLADACGEAGFETFDERDGFLFGYVQQGIFSRDAVDNAIAGFPISGVNISYEVSEADYRDWNEPWEEEGFAPIVVDNVCCIHDGRHLPEHPYPLEVAIGAKLAFGTGNHKTTRMMLSALLSADVSGRNVLDCGCGTGILGIVALKRGARMVVGYDIDEWSVANARSNAEANGVSEAFTVKHGDASLLDAMTDRFHIVMANIARNVLLADVPSYSRMMDDAGSLLLLSGFRSEDVPMLSACGETHGLRTVSVATDGDWACMCLEKNSHSPQIGR